MHVIYVNCIFIILNNILVNYVDCVIYSLKISSEDHVNEVDERFLSFTVDPALLFMKNGNMSKESICMATALSPAYLRLSGPSTANMVFHNYTVTIDNPGAERETAVPGNSDSQGPVDNSRLGNQNVSIITHTQWLKFVHWAQSAGFSLVFSLSNREKTQKGLWDPNSALSILTIADQANLSNIYWELGHNCQNQSFEEYLSDTETLRVISETFPAAWRVVGGDVTPCLHTAPEFREYYSIAAEMADAVLMSQSSSHYLALLPEPDRLNLLQLLSYSPRSLWFSDSSQQTSEVERAAEWMISLGRTARNGFNVHYRELRHDEMYKPTLSFYMALLYKNLVGSRVIEVEETGDPDFAVFAHCTSLRHKAVAGAVTVHAVNARAAAARAALRGVRGARGASGVSAASGASAASGGDVMQFILHHDHAGNIVVNGKEMQNEGDILPVVKRVRPYKSLIINLPPKSFGFWVLTNTDINACKDFEVENENSTLDLNATHKINKRSVELVNDDVSEIDVSEEKHNINEINIPALQERIDDINKELKIIQKTFKCNSKVDVNNLKNHRKKRQVYVNEKQTSIRNARKQRKPMFRKFIKKIKNTHYELKPKKLLQKLLELHSKRYPIETSQIEQVKKVSSKRKRNPKLTITAESKLIDDYENINKMSRQKRSTIDETNLKRSPRFIYRTHPNEDYSLDYEIEEENLEQVDKIDDYGLKYLRYFDQTKDDNSTEYTVEDTTDDSKESGASGSRLVNSTIWKLITAIMDTNTIVNRFWQLFT